jgi:hypothetical protein
MQVEPDDRSRILLCAWTFSLAMLVASGCDDSSTHISTGNATTVDGTTNAAIKTLFDGFESNAIASFWLPGDYGSGLYVPGAIRVCTNYARSGAHSVEITIHEGDIDRPGDADTRVERDELDSGHFTLRGQDAWYGFSFLIPKDFPILDNRLVIGSCKQSDVSRPLTAQRFRNGKHTLTVESQGRKKTYDLPPIPLGKWVDMIYHARYSPGEDGIFQVWMDGKEVVSYTGPLADPDHKNAFYDKIGLYRDRVPQLMTIYYDNYTMGNTYQSVDPARFDQAPR